MREMLGEVRNKTPKKRWRIPHFYDVTWLIFKTLCPVTLIITCSQQYWNIVYSIVLQTIFNKQYELNYRFNTTVLLARAFLL